MDWHTCVARLIVKPPLPGPIFSPHSRHSVTKGVFLERVPSWTPSFAAPP